MTVDDADSEILLDAIDHVIYSMMLWDDLMLSEWEVCDKLQKHIRRFGNVFIVGP